MTSPTLRHSLLVPHQLPTYTVSFPQSPLYPTRMSTDARTILQCTFGPRCGRAAQSVSLLPNNALTEEVKEGNRVTDGFNKNSPSGSTQPQPPDLWPPINIPSIWQTPPDDNGCVPFFIRGDSLSAVSCLF